MMPTKLTPSHQDLPTIAALASGDVSAAIALIRMSGPQAFAIAKQCLRLRNQPLKEIKARYSYYTDFVRPADNTILDDVVAVFFKGPHTYTGEDLVEISCHGSRFITQEILATLLQLGCKAAEPGEFTRRAYLNGRMDLTKAEAIRDLIDAQSSTQWFAARQLATGKLAHEINDLRTKLIASMAILEAQIDFPDEGDTAHLKTEMVHEHTQAVLKRCRELVATFKSGHISAFGPKVVICGLPNAGKSTLLNTLLAKNRAIVTDVPGTTRDYIEEACLVNGRYIRLLDTAGIRDAADQVEAIGVAQAMGLVKEADLVIFLAAIDSDPHAWRPLLADLRNSTDATICCVLSKADLGYSGKEDGFLTISCHTDQGIQQLKQFIVEFVDQHAASIRDIPFINSARHAHGLNAAITGLERINELFAAHTGIECIAFELQDVQAALESIIGTVLHDDILDKIFSDFCVGK